jgi:hypothetical protein
MIHVLIWTVAASFGLADLTSLELRILSTQVALPRGAIDYWDAIGTYTLKGDKGPVTIKLYCSDTDSRAEKEQRRFGFPLLGGMYPNFFSLHAIYREGKGPWLHKDLYRCAREGFWKVAEVKPDAVTIQVRSKLILPYPCPIRFTKEDLERIYRPVPLRLTLKDGTPTLE